MSKLVKYATENLNIVGNPEAPIVVVCDAPPDSAFEEGRTMMQHTSNMFGSYAKQNGFEQDDFVFITPCPPIPPESTGSAKRENEFISQFYEEFRQTVAGFTGCKFLIFLGATAGRQVMNRPIKITKIRGQASFESTYPYPLMGLLSPAHVMRRPELTEIYEADFRQLAMIRDAGWDCSALSQENKVVRYEWKTDISDLIEKPPAAISLDIEYITHGRRWYSDKVELLIVQMTMAEGASYVIPTKAGYLPGFGSRQCAKVIGQIREVLGNPNTAISGFNLKGDLHVLRKKGIRVANWLHDVIQLVFSVDENMQTKSLAESTRRWEADMAGYSDEFDRDTDKNRMDLVPPERMLPYAGGDSDANWRLTRTLWRKLKEDSRQRICYEKVQMNALRTFYRMEQVGLRIDKEALRALQQTLFEQEKEMYASLISQVPASIRRKHIDAGSKGEGNGLSFGRQDFVIDCLFTKQGRGLKPRVFTKTTANLPPDQRIPSTSTKDHLPYFDDDPFVAELIAYQKLQKIRGTYVGEEGGKPKPTRRKNAPVIYTEPTGFWQYFEGEDDRIHPSFLLHRTVTGRSASAEPNAQNFPKRGPIAKAFRRIFVPSPGWKLIEADLSQAELRIAAWMANEPTMIAIYANGGDIHEATAAAIMSVPLQEFQTWKDSDQPVPQQFRKYAVGCTTLNDLYELKRFQAKAVNFGFIYGMGWRKFMAYAKTDYGITFTEAEAAEIREKFFGQYARLPAWHKAMRAFAQKHGYVRALHGAIRHLPNIFSPDEGIQSECERQAINSPVQRFASDLGLIAMSRFGRDCDWNVMRPIAFIHDAVVVEAKDGHEEEAASAIRWYMQNPPLQEWFNIQSPVPILSDVTIGNNLADMAKRGDIEAIRPAFFNLEKDLAA